MFMSTGRTWPQSPAPRRRRAKTRTVNSLPAPTFGWIPGWSAMANGSASAKGSCSCGKRSKRVAQENAIRRRVVASRIRDADYGLVAHGSLAADAPTAITTRLARSICRLYPVKYFLERDCAPAPNTLAAALLLSSFRNEDFALFFSFSDRSA